ncbi:A-kinase anchor protein 6 isoform X1 [Lates japonicus]|uniref:A-kinase anchor protein 6 isoform X1 n=1 Tax=Lates japonicus TaxID=270547 RepID=A0AAD3QX41_LATJO|nr:A-kinase anchor protein 6 isoform X1 [Lates japonicus]
MVPGNFLEPGLVDLHTSAQSQLVRWLRPDDSWEWDESGYDNHGQSHTEVPEPDLTLTSHRCICLEMTLCQQSTRQEFVLKYVQCAERIIIRGPAKRYLPNCPPNNNNIYQVYSLHNVELYRQPQFPHNSSSAKPNQP